MTDKTIKAPLPGTFYRRPDPGADPFVDEGDAVNPGDVVGLVEIMKSFHEVKTDAGGVVTHFLVENEDTVEAGQDVAILGD
jgi:acetyl-CoA carboxylase biotin carboxyl carrier protein